MPTTPSQHIVEKVALWWMRGTPGGSGDKTRNTGPTRQISNSLGRVRNLDSDQKEVRWSRLLFTTGFPWRSLSSLQVMAVHSTLLGHTYVAPFLPVFTPEATNGFQEDRQHLLQQIQNKLEIAHTCWISCRYLYCLSLSAILRQCRCECEYGEIR